MLRRIVAVLPPRAWGGLAALALGVLLFLQIHFVALKGEVRIARTRGNTC